MKRIYLKMLWRAVKLQSGLLVAVLLISDLALAQYPAGEAPQVGEPVRTTVQRDLEIPFKFSGGGQRGTLVCPSRTHPYLLNKSISFVGPAGQGIGGFAVARGVEITTNSAVSWEVTADQGNTPVGSRAIGATFSARHNDPFAFTSTEHFTIVIHCSSDANESYEGKG